MYIYSARSSTLRPRPKSRQLSKRLGKGQMESTLSYSALFALATLKNNIPCHLCALDKAVKMELHVLLFKTNLI